MCGNCGPVYKGHLSIMAIFIRSRVWNLRIRSTDRMIDTSSFVTPVVEHWLEREIVQRVYHEGSQVGHNNNNK